MAVKEQKKAQESSIVLSFSFERSTKRTHRYKEDSEQPVVDTLYVQQSALGGTPPDALTVTIEVA